METQKIINIANPSVVRIPIIECNEILIDLKDQTKILYGPIPESPLTKNYYTKLRATVYEKLILAQDTLPNNWRFRVYEAFRSREVQQMLFEQQYQMTLQKFPQKKQGEIFYLTTQLVSPVCNLNGSVNIPPHNTGAAIDIEIISENGNLVEMGMAIKDWQQVRPELCSTRCSALDDKILKNRKILFEVMSASGFVNYPTEWWHFSYGDRYWAYCVGESSAIYGSADFLLK